MKKLFLSLLCLLSILFNSQDCIAKGDVCNQFYSQKGVWTETINGVYPTFKNSKTTELKDIDGKWHIDSAVMGWSVPKKLEMTDTLVKRKITSFYPKINFSFEYEKKTYTVEMSGKITSILYYSTNPDNESGIPPRKWFNDSSHPMFPIEGEDRYYGGKDIISIDANGKFKKGNQTYTVNIALDEPIINCVDTFSYNTQTLMGVQSGSIGGTTLTITPASRAVNPVAVPIGTVIIFAGDTSTGFKMNGEIISRKNKETNTEWLLCNGAEIKKSVYRKLYHVIGDIYSGKKKEAMFNIPDYQGFFIRGHNNDRSIGSPEESCIQEHEHNYYFTHVRKRQDNDPEYKKVDLYNQSFLSGDALWQRHEEASTTAIEDNYFKDETRPRNVTANFLIRAK